MRTFENRWLRACRLSKLSVKLQRDFATQFNVWRDRRVGNFQIEKCPVEIDHSSKLWDEIGVTLDAKQGELRRPEVSHFVEQFADWSLERPDTLQLFKDNLLNGINFLMTNF